MFKKAVIPAIAAALLTGVLVLPVAAAGPACVDIRSTDAAGTANSRASYNGQTIAGEFFLADESCAQFGYRLVVLDDEGGAPIASASVMGDGSAAMIQIFVSGVTVTDGDVCVYVESTTRNGGKVFDRAPVDGCVILLDDGTSPAGGKGF